MSQADTLCEITLRQVDDIKDDLRRMQNSAMLSKDNNLAREVFEGTIKIWRILKEIERVKELSS